MDSGKAEMGVTGLRSVGLLTFRFEEKSSIARWIV